MLKIRTYLYVGVILLLIIPAVLAGCASPTTTGPATPAVPDNTVTPSIVNTEVNAEANTEFARMLGLVPYSFLQDHDIWFGDPGKAKQIHGFDNITSLEALNTLSADERKQVVNSLAGIAQVYMIINFVRIAPLTGFDGFQVNRTVLSDVPPPWNFRISGGNFDQDLIDTKLIEQGYEKQKYGSYSYYSFADDFSPDIMGSKIAQNVMADLNRIALFDNTLVTAPATEILTGIFDTLDGKENAVIDDPASQALADSLGEVLSAAIISPDRIVELSPEHSVGWPPFDFDLPANWGRLHQYQLTGMGYKDDGQERYWVISLFYANAEDATADANTLANRMETYIFNTQYKDNPNLAATPLTDMYEVGKPSVKSYPAGATLTVECRFKPDTPSGFWLNQTQWFRDFLFLAPDPTPYLKK
jgi:hypothetical protein